MGETIKLLNNCVSIRKFKDEPVSEDLVEQVLRAAFRASNFQTSA
ncbi:MAG: nitroreductase family protein [Alphaproteobacteria bacterium]